VPWRGGQVVLEVDFEVVFAIPEKNPLASWFSQLERP
jgi:hypothetical protein